MVAPRFHAKHNQSRCTACWEACPQCGEVCTIPHEEVSLKTNHRHYVLGGQHKWETKPETWRALSPRLARAVRQAQTDHRAVERGAALIAPQGPRRASGKASQRASR